MMDLAFLPRPLKEQHLLNFVLTIDRKALDYGSILTNTLSLQNVRFFTKMINLGPVFVFVLLCTPLSITLQKESVWTVNPRRWIVSIQVATLLHQHLVPNENESLKMATRHP